MPDSKAQALKVMTIVGTRPEIIKLSRVIAELDRHVRHVLVHTGQNHAYELNQVFFEELGIRAPDHFLNVAGVGPAQTIANVIAKADEILELEKPDAVLLYGDTNSCLSVIPAKRRRIPVFHMEAGNRCFDQRVPEELNRKLIDHLSDINLPLSEQARSYLIAEGIRPETVIKTGSPMKEVLGHYEAQIAKSEALKKLGIDRGKFFLVSAHREENVDSATNFPKLLESLKQLGAQYGWPVIFSTHPRTQQRLERLGVSGVTATGPTQAGQIRFMKPLGLIDYVKLQSEAACVLSDSGTLTEEASILGFPAVMIREAHERPEGMDETTVIMAGIEPASVLEAVRVTIAQAGTREARAFKLVGDYDVDNVSKKVLRIILSYTDYVNRVVWRKEARTPSA